MHLLLCGLVWNAPNPSTFLRPFPCPPSGISWIIIQFINYSDSLLAAPLAFNPTFPLSPLPYNQKNDFPKGEHAFSCLNCSARPQNQSIRY